MTSLTNKSCTHKIWMAGDVTLAKGDRQMNTNETPSQTAMTLVIDTVGEITLPDGTTAHGVVLVVPVGTSQDKRRQTLQAAVRIWSERVTIQPVLREIS